MDTNPANLNNAELTEPLTQEEREAALPKVNELLADDARTRVLAKCMETSWQMFYLARQLLSVHVNDQAVLRLLLETAAHAASKPFSTETLQQNLRKTFLPMVDHLNNPPIKVLTEHLEVGLPFEGPRAYSLPYDKTAVLFCADEMALAFTQQLVIRTVAARDKQVVYLGNKHAVSHPNVISLSASNFMAKAKNIAGWKKGLDDLIQRMGNIDLLVIAGDDSIDTLAPDVALANCQRVLQAVKNLQRIHKFAALVGVQRSYSLLAEYDRRAMEILEDNHIVRFVDVRRPQTGDEDQQHMHVTFQNGWYQYKLPLFAHDPEVLGG